MKTKSKLIITLVSICVAIAVMGVGVWASAQQYSVAVANEVQLKFSNLTGTITAEAYARGYQVVNDNSIYGYNSTGSADLSSTTLFDSSGSKKTSISKNANSETNVQFLGASAFNSTDETNRVITTSTNTAVLWYEFTYTPVVGAVDIGSICFHVVTSYNTTSYLYGNGSIELSTGYFMEVTKNSTTEVIAMGTEDSASSTRYYATSPTATVKIICALIFNNVQGLSLDISQGNWNFTLEVRSEPVALSTGASTSKLSSNSLASITTLTPTAGSTRFTYAIPTGTGSTSTLVKQLNISA